jgi:hypothetical protein
MTWLGDCLAEFVLTTWAALLGPLSLRLHMPLIALQQGLMPTEQAEHIGTLFVQVSNIERKRERERGRERERPDTHAHTYI